MHVLHTVNLKNVYTKIIIQIFDAHTHTHTHDIVNSKAKRIRRNVQRDDWYVRNALVFFAFRNSIGIRKVCSSAIKKSILDDFSPYYVFNFIRVQSAKLHIAKGRQCIQNVDDNVMRLVTFLIFIKFTRSSFISYDFY